MTQLIEQILSLSEEKKIQLIHALSERSAFRTVKAKLPFTIADADKVFGQSQFCLLFRWIHVIWAVAIECLAED